MGSSLGQCTIVLSCQRMAHLSQVPSVLVHSTDTGLVEYLQCQYTPLATQETGG